jgi:hypothetical protein
VVFVSGLLHAERQRLGTRAGTRALGRFKQAILVLRWLLDGTKVKQLALDNGISVSTGYAYLYEGLTVLAAHASGPGIGAARREDGRLFPREHRRHVDRDRPVPHPGPDAWGSRLSPK